VRPFWEHGVSLRIETDDGSHGVGVGRKGLA
jgi:hypothetical protein